MEGNLAHHFKHRGCREQDDDDDDDYYYYLIDLDLYCCERAFSSCREQGLLFFSVGRLLIALASLVRHGLQSTWASGVVVHRLSCTAACGIFQDQGLNPCPLHWQVDSHPLSPPSPPALNLSQHQGLFQ